MHICREPGKYGKTGKGNIVRDELKPSTLSYEFILNFKDACIAESVDEIKARFDNFLKNINIDGCKLIGHIKMAVDAKGKGMVMGSATSFDQNVKWKGEIEQSADNAKVFLNVIVYGLSEDVINKRVDEAFDFSTDF